jgi:hypothetical protein
VPDVVTSQTMRRYLNLTNGRVAFKNYWGRTCYLEPNRGGDFVPCDQLSKLISKGLVVEVIERRGGGGYEGELPYSTQRRIPF